MPVFTAFSRIFVTKQDMVKRLRDFSQDTSANNNRNQIKTSGGENLRSFFIQLFDKLEFIICFYIPSVKKSE